MLPSVTVSLGSVSMAYRSSLKVPFPVCESSMSLIEVEAISTPISDGDLVLKTSSALPNFSESMRHPGKVLTNYFKLWQQV